MLKPLLYAAASAVLMAGCASQPLPAGASRDEVIQRYGSPSRVVPLESGTRLQYSRQPAGQSAMMVDLDAAGRLLSVRQVLTPENFARIGSVAIGKWTRDDAERELGRPAIVDGVASWNGDILTYRWLDGMQDMFFFVYLDRNNIVQRVGQGMEIRSWGDSDR